ncbi:MULTISPECIES: M3 family metallopeptidase [Muribaculum]|uniref:M3 family metallopeptidase n=4 Tax=Muribaculaceae TaxID=2005473 RepID=UPI00248BBF20|nr:MULTISPECIES: M3 family metallopeptidase [Muribaculum]MCX4276672.1 M3 family metallopeptidase [Muribaculum sp.]
MLQAQQQPTANPFFDEFATVHNSVPFSSIENKHYEEAIDCGIEIQNKEIADIVNQSAAPTFDNTIVALERSGSDLNRVLNVFYPMLSALSDDELMDISLRVSGKLSKHSSDISLNEGLWKRIKTVYDMRDKLNLDAEDSMLLTTTYDSFARSGAELKGEKRDEYRRLSAHLSDLTTKFGQNVLKELNTYEIWLTADDLSGLPESSVEAAALAAKEKGREGEYLFTLAQPVYTAFMKYSDRPDLRERFYRLYNGRNTKGEYSNMEILADIAETRREIAALFGKKNYAEYSLEKSMAETPENVYKLLNELAEAYRPAQLKEFAEIESYASQLEGRPVKIKAWDYSYYSNKLQQAKYSYNEEELRPYFELNNVIDGVFGLATKLYGLTFEPNADIEVYHPDVKAYDVKDADGSYLGVIYTDFFPRESKRPGAWMTGFKDECVTADGTQVRPHVTIVMNFTKPTGTKPALLTPYEVETFLHEFGHALHGLLADTKYASLSGTSVYRDFVELPSQFNENYLTQKEFLDGFARHYVTGEPIPQNLVDKIVQSSQYGAAYACLRQLGFGFTDMAWHTIESPVEDVVGFERKALESVSMFDDVDGCIFSPQFSHIFSGGYAAGYYSYKWAEVLDADAFSLFLKNGLFDKATSDSFRRNVLMKGGTEHPMTLYKRFRGQEPTIDALLERDGIKSPSESPKLPQDLPARKD